MPPDEGIKTLSLEILKGLGECPAVSFMEGAVASYIQRFLQDLGLSVETDRHGNLITHLEGGNSSPEGQPPIAFMAHMDHPGFEAVEEREGMVIARALGGVPQACFSQGIPVQVVMPDGGRLLGETSGSYGRESERMIAIQLREPRNLEFPRPVVYDLPDFHFDGDMVRMRALDDLAGCASILVAMQTLASEERAGDVYGVFTRAEEVGLIGARLLAEDGRLPADTLVVSLESSRTLPGAVIGEGPVIRVGDATFTFDAEAEGALIKAREELTERRADFKAQRQLMSGGTCEASGFRYYGYRTTGIAFPLGNYHNATPEGGVGAEYIHIDDFVGGVELIVQAARSVARRRESRPWLRMRDIPQEYRQRLSETRDTLV
jgi:endoglucanase